MATYKWKHLFTKTILNRGRGYFMDGNVYDLEYDGEYLSATVCGSDDYEVEICFDGRNISEMWCDCPYAEDENNCKHMAAVLFAWEEELSDQEQDDINKTHAKTNEATNYSIEQALNTLSEKAVRELLLEHAQTDSGLAEQIIIIANGGISKKQQSTWKLELYHLMRQYDISDYDELDYYNAEPYFEHLLELFYNKVKPLASSGFFNEAFDRLCDLTDAAFVDCDESSDLYEELMQECGELLSGMLGQADITFKRLVYRTCLQRCHRTISAYLTTNLWQNCLLYNFEDPEFLHQNIDLLDASLKNAAAMGEERKVRTLLTYKIDTMTRLGASNAEILEYQKKYWKFPGIRRLAWQEALDRQEWSRAISLLQECKQIDTDQPYLLREYSQLLCELYEKQNETAHCRAELLESIFTYHNFHLDLIQMLKRNSSDEAWNSELQKILECMPQTPDRYKLMMDEGMHRELLDELETDPHLIGLQRYEDELYPYFTEEIRDVFFSYLRRRMESAWNREEYANLIQRLKKMKDYPDGDVMSDELVKEWQTTYKRRSALMDELKKASLK